MNERYARPEAFRTDDLRYALLGPVSVSKADVEVYLGPPKRRALLARLLIEDGRVVQGDRLCEDLWPGRPTTRARVSLQAEISRLRAALEPSRPPHGRGRVLVREARGYALRVPHEARDTVRFEQGVVRAGRYLATGRAREARTRVRQALSLWRGAALEDVRDYHFAELWAARWEDARVAAEELHIAALLQGGDIRQAVSAAEILTGRQPYREVSWSLLLCGLYLAGRHTDALACVDRLSRSMSEDLGVCPGPTVAALQKAILSHDADLIRNWPLTVVGAGPSELSTPGQSAPSMKAEGVPALRRAPGRPGANPAQRRPGAGLLSRPAQLPAAPGCFAGRRDELELLRALLPRVMGEASSTPSIVTVTGMPGVGKTALALFFAHGVLARFPDGQLYADLRAHSFRGDPADTAAVLRAFLTSLGIPATSVPSDTAERAALLRTRLAGRKVLMLLDDVRDEEQIRPLIPGTSSCMIVITSRNQLPGLASTVGARVLALDVPVPRDSRRILSLRLGEDRADTDTVDTLVRHCGGLPMALAVVASRATARPQLSLRRLAEQLADPHRGLEPFTTSDPATDLRQAFRRSTLRLTPQATRLFALLSVHPGPHLSVQAAASVAALSHSDTDHLLDELSRRHLVHETAPGRYALHPLLRRHARELLRAGLDDASRRAAVRRMYDHYLHSLPADAPHLCHLPPVSLPSPARGVTPEQPRRLRQALAWFDTEQAVLAALLRKAANDGFHREAALLAWRLQGVVDACGRPSVAAEYLQIGLLAAQRAGDRSELVRVARALAGCLTRADRLKEAIEYLALAAANLEHASDCAEQILLLLNLTALLHRMGYDNWSIYTACSALALSRRHADPLLEADASNTLGWILALQGRLSEGLTLCSRSLASFRRLRNPQREAYAWDSVGRIHHELGDHAQAVVCYRFALDRLERSGDRFHQVGTFLRLGDSHWSAGDREAASAAWHRALWLTRHHPEGHQVTEIQRRLEKARRSGATGRRL